MDSSLHALLFWAAWRALAAVRERGGRQLGHVGSRLFSLHASDSLSLHANNVAEKAGCGLDEEVQGRARNGDRAKLNSISPGILPLVEKKSFTYQSICRLTLVQEQSIKNHWGTLLTNFNVVFLPFDLVVASVTSASRDKLLRCQEIAYWDVKVGY